MLPHRLTTLLLALTVAMTTAAPLTNQEKLVDAEQADETVNRAKRADEEIVFGNQQNKARVMAKKSDLHNILAPGVAGEQDQGSEVIVHKEQPIDEAMAARAEAALGGEEGEHKLNQAVEAAMHVVSQAEEEKAEAENSNGAEEEAKEDDAAEEKIVETELKTDANGDVKEVEAVAEEEDEAEEEENKQEEELKELEAAAESEDEDEAGNSDNVEDVSSDAGLPVPAVSDDEVATFLQELQQGVAQSAGSDYYRRMYQYMMNPYGGQAMMQGLPVYYRRRRSLAASKNHRRIKRDLLDDPYDPYDLYSLPYSNMDMGDALMAQPEEYVPLTDEEAEYLYKRLLNYLASTYVDEMEAEEAEEAARERESESPYGDIPVEVLDPYLSSYQEPQDEAYLPYGDLTEDSLSGLQSPYSEGYPYGPVDLDTSVRYAKRGMVDYYPRQEEEKRYFFPFADEPSTHWGAFVPEKRDYGEAIQRLQRLAMALSDNPGPYYREMLEEYRRK